MILLYIYINCKYIIILLLLITNVGHFVCSLYSDNDEEGVLARIYIPTGLSFLQQQCS